MDFKNYHFQVEGPGVVFDEERSAGAMRMVALSGAGAEPLEGRAATINVLKGSATALGLTMQAEDFLYMPPGFVEELSYQTEGLLLLTLYAPVSDDADIAQGPLLIPRGVANGYVRVQYQGRGHGWGEEFARFNPEGITYVDKLWGCSRDVLSQELIMPPGAVVPCHVHDKLGQPPDGDLAWQAYYVWEGSAQVEIGNSADAIVTLELAPHDVLLYANGVAHKVVAGEGGVRYIFLEKKAKDDTENKVLEKERDYERHLTLRLDMDLKTFIELETARSQTGDGG